jgi:hypothetical protein
VNTPAAPAGWYQDPSGAPQDRWWDGTKWHDQWRPSAPPPPPQPSSHPAGWYPDAHGVTRYWDGRAWTPQVAPSTPGLAAGRSPMFWLALAGAALMTIGAFGPWATALRVIDVSGTHGDGWIVIGASAFAVLGLFVSRRAGGTVVALIAALIGGAVGLIDLSDIESRGPLVHAAWGIYVVVVGSVVLLVAGLALLVERRAKGR